MADGTEAGGGRGPRQGFVIVKGCLVRLNGSRQSTAHTCRVPIVCRFIQGGRHLNRRVPVFPTEVPDPFEHETETGFGHSTFARGSRTFW